MPFVQRKSHTRTIRTGKSKTSTKKTVHVKGSIYKKPTKKK